MTAPTAPHPSCENTVDPRDALATITKTFKMNHSSVVSYNRTAGDFITKDCLQHLADLEELMGILCFAHEVTIDTKV